VRFLPPRVPPELPITVTWRELWLSGAFIQHDFTWESNFASQAKERGLDVGIGPEPLERLDLKGPIQPIAFAAGGNPLDFLDMAPFEEHMTFREEQPARAWKAYAWDAHGHPHVTALYSPWQLLYLDDVLARGGEVIPLEILMGPGEELLATIERLRGVLEGLHGSWISLNERWWPLMKLLVRLQNRYLPEITGRLAMPFDPETKRRADPWAQERETFDAAAVAEQLGVEHEQVLHTYWFLTERGIDREPRDEMERLRRARPRAWRDQRRGGVRHAQDHFDAAEILRLFLTDLAGEPPERTTSWPMDGRQAFRESLYDRGAVPRLERKELTEELAASGLYPHAVHIVGEGRCEQEMVTTLVAGILGKRAAEEVGFTDLGGAGSAGRLRTMVTGFTTYVRRTVVIVDSEGEMAEYATGLERSGDLPPGDVLRFERNLEESNFTPQELIDVLIDLAANPESVERAAVDLRINEEQLTAEYEQTKPKGGGEDPGLAGVLLAMAEDPAYGQTARISKPEFARALAWRMLEEDPGEADGDAATDDVQTSRRPLLAFVLQRIIPPLMQSKRL
jgi:hypothetical protein